MRTPILRVVFFLLACQSAALAGNSAVVEKWLAAQAGIRSLTADFTQERCLREGRRPIVSEGKFAFAAPGSFRWQMGEPAVTLAVQKKDGDLVVANVKRKQATVYPLALLKAEESALGFSFIEAGFPKTLAEFNENFTEAGVETKDGVHEVTVTLNDRRMSVGLRKMIFYIDEGSFDLRGFYLRFRDSSSITTRFSQVRKNPGLPGGLFEVDLADYQTEVRAAK